MLVISASSLAAFNGTICNNLVSKYKAARILNAIRVNVSWSHGGCAVIEMRYVRGLCFGAVVFATEYFNSVEIVYYYGMISYISTPMQKQGWNKERSAYKCVDSMIVKIKTIH